MKQFMNLLIEQDGLKETADKNSADLKRFDKNNLKYVQRMNIPFQLYNRYYCR